MRNRAALPAVLAFAVAWTPLATAQSPAPPAPPAATANNGGQAIRWEKTVPTIASGPWRGAKLADGQPDVQGHWSNTIANHNNWTDPQAGAPGEPSAAAKLPRDQRAPSRVTDPADGQIPYLPAARAKQQDFAKNFTNPGKPEYVEPLARCAPGGVPIFCSAMW